MKKISWGVLSTANIGTNLVIPAMQKGKYSQVYAISSRDKEKALNTAEMLGIPKAYGSYEEILEDSDIQAVYIPLPNHLHVEWAVKALEAGKHVLCEKPVALDSKQAEYLINKSREFPEQKVMEAFMFRFHPRWDTVKRLIREGTIGEIKNIHSVFTYYNVDPLNIRNQADIGGGGLMDIGCYCISLSRFIYETEPVHVSGVMDYDPEMKIDRLTSAVMDFGGRTATFTCSTQSVDRQYAEIIGSRGRIEIENPFVPSSVRPTKIIHQTGPDTSEINFETCNQYTIQGDLFSLAILNNSNVPTPLDDGVANMKVIDKILESHNTGTVIKL